MSFSTVAAEHPYTAGTRARLWADEVIKYALENEGVDMLDTQKVMVYDILEARAKWLAETPEKPQVIWLRADHASGVTRLLAWIRAVREPAVTKKVLRVKTYSTAWYTHTDTWEEDEVVKSSDPIQVLDNIFEFESLFESAVRSARAIKDPGLVIIVDQDNHFENLTEEARAMVTLVDDRMGTLCSTKVKN